MVSTTPGKRFAELWIVVSPKKKSKYKNIEKSANEKTFLSCHDPTEDSLDKKGLAARLSDGSSASDCIQPIIRTSVLRFRGRQQKTYYKKTQIKKTKGKKKTINGRLE